MHDGSVIIAWSNDDPVRLGHPIVVRLPTGLNVLVVDGHVSIPVPSLMLVKEAQGVAQLMGRHPRSLPPPERGDIHLHTRSFAKAIEGRVVACLRVAGEINVLLLGGMRHEGDVGPGIHPQAHGQGGIGRLVRVQLRDIVRNDSLRPRRRLFRFGIDVRGIRGRLGVLRQTCLCQKGERQHSGEEGGSGSPGH